jgi:hypothetical protein
MKMRLGRRRCDSAPPVRAGRLHVTGTLIPALTGGAEGTGRSDALQRVFIPFDGPAAPCGAQLWGPDPGAPGWGVNLSSGSGSGVGSGVSKIIEDSVVNLR